MLSVAHINLYSFLHGKTITREAAASFLELIQSDITSHRITRAKDRYCDEIETIQSSLARICNSTEPGETVKIELLPASRKKYSGIIRSQGLGVLPMMASAAFAKLCEHHFQNWFSKPKPIAGIEETISLSEAKDLGIPVGGLGFVEKDIYKEINKKIIDFIEKEKELPWRKPWRDGYTIKGKTYGPQNYVTGKPYHGANAFLIGLNNMINGTRHKYFLTKKQIDERGGSLLPGSKPTPVWVFIKGEEKEKDSSGKEIKTSYQGIITYEVYPLEFTKNVKPVKRKTIQEGEGEIIVDAETLVSGMPKRPSITNDGGNRAYYTSITDSVHMPLKNAFSKAQEYYATLFHELIHSTGHKKRIGREFGKKFGDKKYAFEELIAEIGSAYLCGVTNIDYHTLKNSAAYIKSWASNLKSEIRTDRSFLFRAILAATKASKFIIGNTLLKKGETLKESAKKQKPARITRPKRTAAQTKPSPASYYIRQYTEKRVWDWVKVNGSEISLPGYKAFDFFVFKGPENWSLSEAKTGASISKYAKTRKDAIKKAIDTLKKEGKERLEQNIKSIIDQQGISPRYDNILTGIKMCSGKLCIGKIRSQETMFSAASTSLGSTSSGIKASKKQAPKTSLEKPAKTEVVEEKKPEDNHASAQTSRKRKTIEEMKAEEFTLLGLDGKWLELIGQACRPTSMLIYGPGGSGKSTLTLVFAYYLAHKGNKVLYAAGEQYGTPVFRDMLTRLDIHDHENFTIVPNLKEENLNEYDLIVADSKDNLHIGLGEFIKLREAHPGKCWVILSQGTASGKWTGPEAWRNEVDTLIYCKNLVAYTNKDKNRWGGKAEIPVDEFKNTAQETVI